MIDRRNVLSGIAASLVGGAAANRAEACVAPEVLGICRMGTQYAGIDRGSFSLVAASQETMVWCWAATLQMIFAWHRKRISQASIVRQVYGAPVHAPIQPLHLLHAIQRAYVDDGGNRFRVSAGVFDLFTGRATIGNDHILAEFRRRRPIIYCNQSHMVAVYGGHFSLQGTAYSPNVTFCQLEAADPWPPRRGMFRHLQACEMVPAFFPGGQLRLVATVNVY
jgi:hypothetical protein